MLGIELGAAPVVAATEPGLGMTPPVGAAVGMDPAGPHS